MTRFGRAWRRFERDRRFWRLVAVDGPAACWAWSGPVDADGDPVYGGRPAWLHAYELARGPVPTATRIDRRCGHRLCVNPDHFGLVEDVEA